MKLKFTLLALLVCVGVSLQSCDQIMDALNMFNLHYSWGDQEEQIPAIGDATIGAISFHTMKDAVQSNNYNEVFKEAAVTFGEQGIDKLIGGISSWISGDGFHNGMKNTKTQLPLVFIANVVAHNTTNREAAMSRLDVRLSVKDGNGDWQPADIEIAVGARHISALRANAFQNVVADQASHAFTYNFGQQEEGFEIQPDQKKVLPVAIKVADLYHLGETFKGNSGLTRIIKALTDKNPHNIRLEIKPYFQSGGQSIGTTWIPITPGQWLQG